MNVFVKEPPEESKLPKNVKQIGNIEDDVCIYIEDYVYTYLYQYAKSDLSGDKVAFLVGEKFKNEDEDVLIIKGAVQGKHIKKEDGNLIFTTKTWDAVEDDLKEYFDGLAIIGWVNSQPGYGIFMTGNHIDIHNKYFSNQNQVLYLIDPIEKNEAFYVWRKSRLVELQGYFIYYARNEPMHEYMLDNRIIKVDNKDKAESEKEKGKEDIIIKYRKQERKKKKENHQNNIMNMLTSLSIVLFVICIVMGLGLLNNVDRVGKLEDSYNRLYENLIAINNKFSNRQIQQVSLPENKLVNKNESSTKQEGNNQNDVKNIESRQIKDKTSEASKLKNQSEEQNINDNNEVKEEPKQTSTEIKKVVTYNVPNSYVVQPGDSLNKISYRFYKTTEMVNKILQVNKMKNPNKIYIGQVLKLPKY